MSEPLQIVPGFMMDIYDGSVWKTFNREQLKYLYKESAAEDDHVFSESDVNQEAKCVMKISVKNPTTLRTNLLNNASVLNNSLVLII